MLAALRLFAVALTCVVLSACMVTKAMRSEVMRPPPNFNAHQPPTRAHLVYVGGNSQHCDGNTRQLLGMWDDVAKDVADALHVPRDSIRRHYFSWVGDTFSPRVRSCVPSVFNRPWHGEEYIDAALHDAGVFDDSRVPLIFVGYSNGGATAFDAVALMCRVHGEHVSLLVTLDPVSRLAGRNTFLGASTWLNVYALEHDAVIFTGGPWRGNAPESSLNRLVPGAIHGDVRLFWNEVADSTAFSDWGASTRRAMAQRQAPGANCRYIGSRNPRLE